NDRPVSDNRSAISRLQLLGAEFDQLFGLVQSHKQLLPKGAIKKAIPGPSAKAIPLVVRRRISESYRKHAERDHEAMRPASFKTENDTGSAAKLAYRILFGLFLAQWFLVWTNLLSHHRTLSPMRWPEALLVLFAAANTLATFSCELTWQNVLAASVLITLVSGASEGLAVLTGAPSAGFVASGS